jgi:YggT family protein
MGFIMNVVGSLAGLYLLLIFVRVIFTWFSGAYLGRPVELLARITDPYLDWWRRFPILRAGFLDLSPIAAMTTLSLVQTICGVIANYGRITLGLFITIVLQSLWSVISFILGFLIIVLLLRLLAYLTNRNIYSIFWRVIDSIAQPVLYRVTRFFFRRRLINYLWGILLTTGVLAALMFSGSALVYGLSYALRRFPF